MIVRDHTFAIPLDHTQPSGETIAVFAREVVDAERDADKTLPWFVYHQGGPGLSCMRITSGSRSGWLKKALEKHRVLLVDQRGTGRSTPVMAQTLAGKTPPEQVAWLTNFRADSIVRDFEFIRCALGVPKWTSLGQSYGGFITLTYLSLFPESLTACYITGGIPSLDRPVDDVYRETYKFCRAKSEAYYAKYPEDERKVAEVVAYLRENRVMLPSGEALSVRRLQLLGMELGFARGNDQLHTIFEAPFVDTVNGRELSYNFLRSVENAMPFNTNPIFTVLHESIYAQGSATRWSSERLRAAYPEFSEDAPRFLFAGEMIGPWMLDSFAQLQPLKEAADLLAEKSDWGRLYDVDVLAKNTVPVAAAVYFEDMFVNQAYSLETAKRIPGCKVWVTNEYEHCGLGVDGERVLGRLMELAR
jgi:pimeloyl-ACP methyl ester carboxylesterase